MFQLYVSNSHSKFNTLQIAPHKIFKVAVHINKNPSFYSQKFRVNPKSSVFLSRIASIRFCEVKVADDIKYYVRKDLEGNDNVLKKIKHIGQDSI